VELDDSNRAFREITLRTVASDCNFGKNGGDADRISTITGYKHRGILRQEKMLVVGAKLLIVGPLVKGMHLIQSAHSLFSWSKMHIAEK
jgi:hypothetical protein